MSEETKRIEAGDGRRATRVTSVLLLMCHSRSTILTLVVVLSPYSVGGVVLISKSEQQHIPFEASR